jgi:hypothetical protein
MHHPRRSSLLLWIVPALALACAADPATTDGTVTAASIASDVGTTSDGTGDTSSSSGAVSSSTITTTTSIDEESGSSSVGGTTAVDATSSSGESTGSSSICDTIIGEDFIVPDSCDGPSGNTATAIPANGLFSTSWFGCYFDEDGDLIQDQSDNCEFACGSQGLCSDDQDGPNCEANLQWFAADADRYGCGGRIRVTNCDNGNAVVLVTLDRGPNCAVEMDCGAPVLDMSHDAMIYLFEGSRYGGCDQQAVVVEAVDEATPLGPV